MPVSERSYSWTDEARVLVWPPEPAAPHFHSDLATCVRRAIAVAEGQPTPEKVEIEHASGFIPLEEIRRMAADPSLPKEAATTTASRLP